MKHIFKLLFSLAPYLILFIISLSAKASSFLSENGFSQESRPWDLSFRVFGGHNDNVPLVPERTFFNGDQSSPYIGLSLDSAYRLVQERNFIAGIALSVDQLFYLDDKSAPNLSASDPNDYNLTAVMPGAFARYFFDAWGRPASVGMAYHFRRDWLSDIGAKDAWSSIHVFNWDANIRLCHHFEIGGSYRLSVEDFDDNRAAPRLNSRDSLRHTLGVSAKYFFDQERRHSFAVNYQYSQNDTDGRNFDVDDSHAIAGRLESNLYGPLWLGLNASYIHEDYDGFVSGFIPAPGRQKQDIHKYRAQLLWIFNRNLSMDLYYEHTDYDANQKQFEADRNDFGAGLTYRF
ncbi:MAG: hypothetical protein ACU826_03925 [Gammaproteobacteria bacterium]